MAGDLARVESDDGARNLLGRRQPTENASVAATFRHLDPSRFPATVALADHLPVPWEDEFTFGLDLIVDGLAQALRHDSVRGG